MDFDLGEILLDALIPVFLELLLPLLVWTIIPAAIFKIIFKKKIAWTVGAFIGVALCFYIGPLSSQDIL